jgi:hypothetical protein
VNDKLMSNTRVQNILQGGEGEAQDRFTLSGDPRYKQTFLDYDRPFDPYALSFWDTNPDLVILDEEAAEEETQRLSIGVRDSKGCLCRVKGGATPVEDKVVVRVTR